MKDAPLLHVENVSKRFGRVDALRSVDLSVGADELVAVLGPTGAGKTTLLRTVAGLETPDAGRIVMAGRDVTRHSPAQRDVALVFENFSLYPNWTVRQNLRFPLKAPGRNLARDEITRRVAWAADLLRISPLLDRKATRLSGGEMQRVAIGRAIVRRPRIFLFDEPLTNLDAKLRESLRAELVCLRRELATPMLFVTHDQVEALSMGDRIAVLDEGCIGQTGTPEEVYHRPATPAVARRLGSPPINILPVRREGGQWVTDVGLAIAPAGPDGGDEMLLGIRPEDVSPTGGDRPATVRVVEDMGPTRIVLADWAGRDVHLIVPATTPVAPGDEISPRVAPDRFVLWPLQVQ